MTGWRMGNGTRVRVSILGNRARTLTARFGSDFELRGAYCFSWDRSFFLRASPQRYPASSPSLRTTRWQGTATATGLLAQALATARTAFGSPISLATSL